MCPLPKFVQQTLVAIYFLFSEAAIRSDSFLNVCDALFTFPLLCPQAASVIFFLLLKSGFL